MLPDLKKLYMLLQKSILSTQKIGWNLSDLEQAMIMMMTVMEITKQI